MFFTLSKLAWLVLQPSAALILLGLGGLILSWSPLGARFRREARVCLTVSLAGLLVIAFSPLGRGLTGVLEDRIPKAGISGTPGGIVVLGGAVHMGVSAARGEPALLSGAERLLAAHRLAKRYPGIPVLLSGGDNALLPEENAAASEAEIMRDILVSLGIEEDRLIVETGSRNTFENAVRAKALAAPSPDAPWVLVTSAFHMPRALGTFRQAGFPVTAHPVDYQTRGPDARWRFYYSSSDGISQTDFAAKEWLGLLAYYLSGKTDALFPAP